MWGKDPHVGIGCEVLGFFLGSHYQTVFSRRFSSSAENKLKVKADFCLGGKSKKEKNDGKEAIIT